MSQRFEIQLSLLSKSLNKNCRDTVLHFRLFQTFSKLLFFFNITSIAFKLSPFNLLQKMINFHLINLDLFFNVKPLNRYKNTILMLSTFGFPKLNCLKDSFSVSIVKAFSFYFPIQIRFVFQLFIE